MDVLAIILACSVYPDETLVRAMVDLGSQRNPHFVGDLSTMATYDGLRSRSDARRVVRELERGGGQPLLGLLALPPAWARHYGQSTDSLFDGCMNVWIGTTALASHYEACRQDHAPRAPPREPPAPPRGPAPTAAAGFRQTPPEVLRLCALRRFGQGLGFTGYADAVLALLPKQRILFAPEFFSRSFAAQPAVQNAGRLPPETPCRCADKDEPWTPSARKRRSRHPGKRDDVAIGWDLLSPGGAPILE